MKASILFFFLSCFILIHAHPVLAQNRTTNPYPPFQVIGNLYSVGGSDLSVFLITSDAGHILINTGWGDSTPLIRDNIAALGFSLDDVEILLAQHAHGDHTGALAEIKQLTGAALWASAEDTPVLEDGGFSDPQFGGRQGFEPVEVDQIFNQGDSIELGGNRLTAHIHPGHTEGATSFTMTVRENGRDYRVLIANMGSVNAGKRLAVNPTYPGVAADFAYTFTTQKAMDIDVWVSAHGNQYNRDEKWQPGQAYSPDTFVDPEGFKAKVEEYQTLFLEALAAEH